VKVGYHFIQASHAKAVGIRHVDMESQIGRDINSRTSARKNIIVLTFKFSPTAGTVFFHELFLNYELLLGEVKKWGNLFPVRYRALETDFFTRRSRIIVILSHWLIATLTSILHFQLSIKKEAFTKNPLSFHSKPLEVLPKST
jgi:hypothetical protein